MDSFPYVVGFSLSVLVGVACVQALSKRLRDHFATDHQSSESGEVIATVLFFPDETRRLPSHHLSLCNSNHNSSLNRMLSFLRAAEHSIDVCVMVFTCKDLAQELVGALDRGVAVRVILDYRMALADGSVMNYLRRNSIAVRTLQNISAFSNSEVINPLNSNDIIDVNGNQEIMHHKYAVLDGQHGNRVVMTGSFNWTKTAALHNRENVTVTNLHSIVNPFQVEFDNLWSLAS